MSSCLLSCTVHLPNVVENISFYSFSFPQTTYQKDYIISSRTTRGMTFGARRLHLDKFLSVKKDVDERPRKKNQWSCCPPQVCLLTSFLVYCPCCKRRKNNLVVVYCSLLFEIDPRSALQAMQQLMKPASGNSTAPGGKEASICVHYCLY